MADLAQYRRDLWQIMALQQSIPLSSKTETKISSFTGGALAASSSLSFPRFLELPIEVRLNIWRHCLPGPRAVEIDYGESSGCLRSKYPPPIALSVCRESRVEAQRHYELFFQRKPDSGYVYFDYSKDTLHFQQSNLFSVFPPEETLQAIGNDLARVRFLSFCLHASGTLSMPSLPDSRAFHNLQEIIFLVPPGGPDGPDRVFVDPSAVTLSPSCSFKAIEFLQDGNYFAQLWSGPDIRNLFAPKVSIMSYISGDYRVC